MLQLSKWRCTPTNLYCVTHYGVNLQKSLITVFVKVRASSVYYFCSVQNETFPRIFTHSELSERIWRLISHSQIFSSFSSFSTITTLSKLMNFEHNTSVRNTMHLLLSKDIFSRPDEKQWVFIVPKQPFWYPNAIMHFFKGVGWLDIYTIDGVMVIVWSLHFQPSTSEKFKVPDFL